MFYWNQFDIWWEHYYTFSVFLIPCKIYSLIFYWFSQEAGENSGSFTVVRDCPTAVLQLVDYSGNWFSYIFICFWFTYQETFAHLYHLEWSHRTFFDFSNINKIRHNQYEIKKYKSQSDCSNSWLLVKFPPDVHYKPALHCYN